MPEAKNLRYSLYPRASPSPPPDPPIRIPPLRTASLSSMVNGMPAPASTQTKKWAHSAHADVLTRGAPKAHDLEQALKSNPTGRVTEYDGISEESDRSHTFSVGLDEEGAAPAPPEFVRTEDGKRVPIRKFVAARKDSSDNTVSPDSRDLASLAGSQETVETRATSVQNLPALQAKGPWDEEQYDPVSEDDPTNYNLIQPNDNRQPPKYYSLERRGEEMFSREHLETIFQNPTLLMKFTTFLGTHRRDSVSTLIYYLDALKALRAINYANAVAEALDPLQGLDFTKVMPKSTFNEDLEDKANQAFDVMVREDLPAYITHVYINLVSVSIQRRITGTLPPHLREASEGLAEVFCLSDPSRHDNPIVFASEEFHRTTQYGNSYAVGRNCRFLQGPRTNQYSVRRLREAVKAGRDHSETFINYRRDGSPFMNLLMTAPLRDSRGNLRYFIGAQVDVSGLAKECTELDALQQMLADQEEGDSESDKKDEFQELSEMFNQAELDIVKRTGGRMHRKHVEGSEDANAAWHRPRLLLKDEQPMSGSEEKPADPARTVHGRLSGVYTNYLLVRPYPSLRILFTSPSLRVPGVLQSPFMNRIGSSDRVREELVAAFAEGRGVTAKVRWISRNDGEGRNRWIHCTPLLGQNNNIGVWMVVLVDDEASILHRRFRQPPPVPQNISNGRDEVERPRPRRTFDSRPSTAQSNYTDGYVMGSPSVQGRNEFDFRSR